MSMSTRLSALAASVALLTTLAVPPASADPGGTGGAGSAGSSGTPTVNLATNPGFELPSPDLAVKPAGLVDYLR
ncbi:hypothetical protein [Kitasatospora sp. NPDC017646]|uniref:hypothetical protein n=1 Tax=Kitasatospora sp. NPDC017646 TaxID=3364024 RepID=UPI00379EB1F5